MHHHRVPPPLRLAAAGLPDLREPQARGGGAHYCPYGARRCRPNGNDPGRVPPPVPVVRSRCPWSSGIFCEQRSSRGRSFRNGLQRGSRSTRTWRKLEDSGSDTIASPALPSVTNCSIWSVFAEGITGSPTSPSKLRSRAKSTRRWSRRCRALLPDEATCKQYGGALQYANSLVAADVVGNSIDRSSKVDGRLKKTTRSASQHRHGHAALAYTLGGDAAVGSLRRCSWISRSPS